MSDLGICPTSTALFAGVTAARRPRFGPRRKKLELLFAHLKRILKLDRVRRIPPRSSRQRFKVKAGGCDAHVADGSRTSRSSRRQLLPQYPDSRHSLALQYLTR